MFFELLWYRNKDWEELYCRVELLLLDLFLFLFLNRNLFLVNLFFLYCYPFLLIRLSNNYDIEKDAKEISFIKFGLLRHRTLKNGTDFDVDCHQCSNRVAEEWYRLDLMTFMIESKSISSNLILYYGLFDWM